MTFDQDDIQSAALCACKEGRGDGSYLGVLWVIAHRAWDWGETVHNVIYAKNQFSSMSIPSDPEFNWTPTLPADVAIYQHCLEAAPDILNRLADDPTLGSHFYENPKVANSPWFTQNISADHLNHPLKAVIGKQNFYL